MLARSEHSTAPSDRAIVPPFADPRSLPRRRVAAMRRAARDLFAVLEECARAGRHPVRDVLEADAGGFAHWARLPLGDVEDAGTGSSWYYHAHDQAAARGWSEHGHFHCFMYTELVQEGAAPLALPDNADPVKGGLIHLVAISIDPNGLPTRMFAPNRWVTGEWLFPAREVVPLIDRFAIRAALPCRLTSRWLAAMLRLFHPQIDWLLHERERVLEERRKLDPRGFADDRAIEIAACIAIDLDAHLEALERGR
jgi:hypothetical protein